MQEGRSQRPRATAIGALEVGVARVAPAGALAVAAEEAVAAAGQVRKSAAQRSQKVNRTVTEAAVRGRAAGPTTLGK